MKNRCQKKTSDNLFPTSLDAIQESVAFLDEYGKIIKFKYYIGKYLSFNKTNEEFEGSFLRYRTTKQFQGYIYSLPNVRDICVFRYDQIVGQFFPVTDAEHPQSSKREYLYFQLTKAASNKVHFPEYFNI